MTKKPAFLGIHLAQRLGGPSRPQGLIAHLPGKLAAIALCVRCPMCKETLRAVENEPDTYACDCCTFTDPSARLLYYDVE